MSEGLGTELARWIGRLPDSSLRPVLKAALSAAQKEANRLGAGVDDDPEAAAAGGDEEEGYPEGYCWAYPLYCWRDEGDDFLSLEMGGKSYGFEHESIMYADLFFESTDSDDFLTLLKKLQDMLGSRDAMDVKVFEVTEDDIEGEDDQVADPSDRFKSPKGFFLLYPDAKLSLTAVFSRVLRDSTDSMTDRTNEFQAFLLYEMAEFLVTAEGAVEHNPQAMGTWFPDLRRNRAIDDLEKLRSKRSKRGLE